MDKIASLDEKIKQREAMYLTMSDEDMAEKLNMSVIMLTALRRMGGLERKSWGSVFNDHKRVRRDNSIERFVVNFQIHPENLKAIGLDFRRNYKYMAYASDKEIRLEFVEV